MQVAEPGQAPAIQFESGEENQGNLSCTGKLGIALKKNSDSALIR